MNHTMIKMISQNLTTNQIFKEGRLKSAFFKIFSFLMYALLIYHFAILAIYQLPDNPIKHKFKMEISNYVDPFFSQAWTLFAPNPINSNMSLFYQFQYSKNGKVFNSPWIDVTEPIIKNRRQNFFSPYLRISKFTQSSMMNINENNTLLVKYIKEHDTLENDKVKADKFYKKAMDISYGHKSIIQYSQFVAKNYFKGDIINAQKIYVKYKIFNSKFPRFSKRNLDYYNLKNYTFEQLESTYYKIK